MQALNRICGAATTSFLLLLSLAWLATPGNMAAQPANYTDETVVANYVKGLLYWPDADPANRASAAFRYKLLLYRNDAGIHADLTNMANLYGSAERTRSLTAEEELRCGLTNSPASTLLGNLLLDLYYDRTVAEAILARDAVERAECTHFGPPIAVPASGLMIDNEVAAYTSALASNRTALATYCMLFTNDLGVADGDPTPLGYRLFQQLVPGRGLNPANYLSNGVPVAVTTDTSPLFTGYKDLVLLYELLSDQGRTASTLARLLFLRNGVGDVSQAQALITDAQRSLFLHLHALRTAFPALDASDASLADSGLSAAMASVSDSLDELEGLKQLQRSQLNPLGFEPDFLVFLSGSFAGEAAQDDTYDALMVHLGQTGSVLDKAKSALATARASYAQYRGFQDQLAGQSASSCITYNDRLRDIVGYFPDDPSYSIYPQGAPGSELDQQAQTIAAAQLQIRKNRAEIANLKQQVNIELTKAASISAVYVNYGNQQASLTEYIGMINGAQAAADELADAADSAGSGNFGGTAGHSLNAAAQCAAEIAKGQYQAEKERLAAAQSAEITGLEATATVNTLMLQMNTLVVDSLSAAVELRKQMNKLQDLYREKAQLERNLQASDRNLTRRYFADPVHRLTMQADMIAADRAFNEARQWLFFMARALEYKWNTPFSHNYLGRTWTLDTLFKLRNADELDGMYQAMKDSDNLRSLYEIVDDRWDWLSLREDVLGYRRFGNTNEVLTYVDPVTGETVDAITMFHRYLQRHQSPDGTITLEFSSVLENQNTFFRGPYLGWNGYWLDKIDSMIIRLPGHHTTTNYTQWDTLLGTLGYGGSSYLRNEYVGSPAPGRPDRLVNEMTAYSTKWWYEATNGWRFREIRTNGVSMLKADPSVARGDHDFPSDIPDRLATGALIINTFRERSVATSRWILSIPTRHPTIPGREVLRINELDDIEIYFYHWSYERP